jgi:hypothetical protein
MQKEDPRGVWKIVTEKWLKETRLNQSFLLKEEVCCMYAGASNEAVMQQKKKS